MSAPHERSAKSILIWTLLAAVLAVVCCLPRPAPARAAVGPIEILGAPDDVDDAAGVEARAVRFVDEARVSLHAALYELGLPSVAMALRQAQARGVDVRLFLESDNRSAARERDCLGLLADVPIRFDGRRPLMHDKFMIADGARVWTGSANLTWTGCHLHYNEAVLIRDEALAMRYEDQFRRLYEGEDDAPAGPPLTIGEARVNCAFAPGEDRLRPFLDAVDAARGRIEVAAFSLTHERLVDALARRAREGLAVDVVLDARLAHGPAGRRAVRVLGEAGCALREGGPRPSMELVAHFGLPVGQDVKIHHKLLLADGTRVVTGSANLSANGFEHNDENVLSIEGSPRVGRVYEALLSRARAASQEIGTGTNFSSN